MRLRTFIDRPILSCVISVLILLVGIISLVNLPMEQYPDIAPPTISVSASYTGANAETVQKSVVVPLEEAINGVENMLYMTSTSTNTGSGLFQPGNRPGHGHSERKEPRGRSRRTASCRGHQSGSHCTETAK